MTFNRFRNRRHPLWKEVPKSNKERALEFFLSVRDQRDVMDPLACWLWPGQRNRGGYGIIHFGKESRAYLVHRLSFEFAKGRIHPGFVVMHDCPGGDNPACYNPNHLFLGTQEDNMQDMARKHRQWKQRQQ